MSVKTDNTFWAGNSDLQNLANALQKLVPAEGMVANARKNKALEKFRVASNCYYDLYNNGLYNRASQFRAVFKLASSLYRYGPGRYVHARPLRQELYDLTEVRMRAIVVAAAVEQKVSA